MAGSSNALQKACDRMGRADLANELDVSDVNAELERRRGDHRSQLAALEPSLRGKSLLFGEAAMMRRDGHGAETVGKLAGNTFCHSAGVDEDERRPMILDQLRQSIINLVPDLRGHDRFERGGGHLKREVSLAIMTAVHDHAIRSWLR